MTVVAAGFTYSPIAFTALLSDLVDQRLRCGSLEAEAASSPKLLITPQEDILEGGKVTGFADGVFSRA